jgi:pantothenate kinase
MNGEGQVSRMPSSSDAQTEGLLRELVARLVALASQGRRMVAIVGPPGSGKSTFSCELCRRLNACTPGLAAAVQMDGFHYDDAVLQAQGTLARKGAPFTFDVGGLRSLLERLRANREAEIAVPVFDRALEVSRAGAQLIPRSVPLILVEGNYLLLDEEPWRELRPLFDFSVALLVPPAELERRLVDRWVALGLDRSVAEERARNNDLENARRVMAHSAPADIELPLG